MKGYTNMKMISSPNSKAMDLSDLLTSLEPTKTNSTSTTDTHQETKKSKNNNDAKTNSNNKDSFLGSQEDEERYKEEMFSMKLKRNSSVSASASALHSVKKAFSIKRSSSVSERYCRIHDQPITVQVQSPPHDDHYDADHDDDTKPSRSIKRKNGRGRILKACKRIFGL